MFTEARPGRSMVKDPVGFGLDLGALAAGGFFGAKRLAGRLAGKAARTFPGLKLQEVIPEKAKPRLTMRLGEKDLTSAARPEVSLELGELFDRAAKGHEPQLDAVRYSRVTPQEAEAIKGQTGLDVVGASKQPIVDHAIDGHALRHLLKKHGDPEAEALRGQLAITREDIEALPDIVGNPDLRVYGGKTKQGVETFWSAKRVNGTVYYLEEVRTKRGLLMPKTMIKAKKEAAASDVPARVQKDLKQSPSVRPETLRSHDSNLASQVEPGNKPIMPWQAWVRGDLAAKPVTGSVYQPHLAGEALRGLGRAWQEKAGDPLWRFISETLPEKAGDRYPVIDAVNRGIITDYKKPADYVKGRDLVKVNIENAQDGALQLAHALGGLSPAEQKRAAQIIRGGVTTQPDKYQAALEASRRFAELEGELRELGVLKGDTYLTQYTRKELAGLRNEVERLDKQLANWAGRTPNYPGKAAALNKLRARRDEAADKLQRHYATSGKKYLTRAYEKWEQDSGMKLDIWPFQKKPERLGLSYTNQRQDLTPEARKAMGEIEAAPYLVGKGLLEQYHDRELARWFGKVAENPEWSTEDAAEAASRGFKQLPQSPKLGHLSGRYVDPYIYDDIDQAVTMQHWALKTYDKILSAWKAGKVLYNPATWSRNVMSNMILADMVADLSPARVDVFLSAAKDLITKGPDYQELKSLGQLGREWYGNEIKRYLPALEKPGLGGVMQALLTALPKTTDKLGQGYQGIEQLFKVAVYKHRKNLGDTPEIAARYAEKAIFDYGKIPPAVRWAKRWYSPFVTFTYKAIPAMAEAAVKKPWKAAKWAIISQGVKEAARLYLGQSKQEADREEAVLPDYMARQTAPLVPSHLKLPLTDKYGRSKYLDLTYLLPWGDVGEQWGQSDFTFRPLMPSHPLFTVASDLYHNREGFSGMELMPDWMDPWEKAKALGGYLWRQAMPSLFGSYSSDKLVSAFSGGLDRQGRPRSKWEALLDTMLGLKVRSIDYNEEAVKRMREHQRQLQDMRSAYSRELLEMERNGVAPEKIQERLEEYQRNVGRIVERIKERFD